MAGVVSSSGNAGKYIRSTVFCTVLIECAN